MFDIRYKIESIVIRKTNHDYLDELKVRRRSSVYTTIIVVTFKKLKKSKFTIKNWLYHLS